MVTIKSAFKDYIDRIVYYNSAKPALTKEISVTDEHNKAYIIDLFKLCISFSIENDSIVFIVNKTEEEIQKSLAEHDQQIKNSINCLNRWCKNSESDKLQITTYLKKFNLNWILNQLL